MANRLTEDAPRAVLTFAAQEARRRGDRRLGTDHLLLGLLHDAGSTAAKALGVSLADARAASDALDAAALAAVGVVGVVGAAVGAVGASPGAVGVDVAVLAAPGAAGEVLPEGAPPTLGRRFPPLTSGARAVLKRAADEARRCKSGRISTTHFLIALLSLVRPDPAAELLTALGADPPAVRARLGSHGEGDVA